MALAGVYFAQAIDRSVIMTIQEESIDFYLEPTVVTDLQVRLNRIEGHVRGVRGMLDDQTDCRRVITQLLAVQAALNQVTTKVLEGHIDNCIADYFLFGDQAALDRLQRTLAIVVKTYNR